MPSSRWMETLSTFLLVNPGHAYHIFQISQEPKVHIPFLASLFQA